MSKLATSKVVGFDRTIIQETAASPDTEAEVLYSLELIPKSSWMSPILHYLQSGVLPLDEGEIRNIRRKSSKYTLLSGKLYRMGKAIPMLRFLRFLGENNITQYVQKFTR